MAIVDKAEAEKIAELKAKMNENEAKLNEAEQTIRQNKEEKEREKKMEWDFARTTILVNEGALVIAVIVIAIFASKELVTDVWHFIRMRREFTSKEKEDMRKLWEST